MYDYGFGVEKSEPEASKWILMAAKQGFDKAQYNMGKRYRDGFGVATDKAASAKWFLAAARQGHVRAQHRIGVRLANGDGVKKDIVAAFMWLTLSARGGNKSAADKRDEIRPTLSAEQHQEAERMIDDWKPKQAQAKS